MLLEVPADAAEGAPRARARGEEVDLAAALPDDLDGRGFVVRKRVGLVRELEEEGGKFGGGTWWSQTATCSRTTEFGVCFWRRSATETGPSGALGEAFIGVFTTSAPRAFMV